MRFQVMAPRIPASTAACVIAVASTRPWPIVFATAVPVMAPRKFRPAAMRIACQGASTRVAMTVAIAFAVSWEPLMKSKMTAKTITTPSRTSVLSMLDCHALQGVRDVLASVGRILELLVDLLPADEVEDVLVVGEQ